jgi:hypothetical protein
MFHLLDIHSSHSWKFLLVDLVDPFLFFFRLHFGEDSHEQQEPIRLKSQTIGKHFIVMTATPQGY